MGFLCYLKLMFNLLGWCFYMTDLHSIGGLYPLLGYLKNSHANIRAKAADVVTTVVQNNPRSQQLVMEANGFESLLANFTLDPDITVRTKALGAISCKYRLQCYDHCVRHYSPESPPPFLFILFDP